MSEKKVLLFGGGGCHDYKAVCPLLKKQLENAGMSVEYVAEDFDALLFENLTRFDTVALYYTGGDLPLESKRGLVEWVAAGGGFAGVHCAADSFKSSPEYLAMLGGVFQGHPFKRNYIVSLVGEKHPIIDGIEGYSVKDWEKWPVYEFPVHDEQYLIDVDSRVKVLATTVFRSRLWPVSWAKPWGQGRVFYLAIGHDVEACSNAFFEKMFVNGVCWTAESEPMEVEKDAKFSIS